MNLISRNNDAENNHNVVKNATIESVFDFPRCEKQIFSRLYLLDYTYTNKLYI